MVRVKSKYHICDQAGALLHLLPSRELLGRLNDGCLGGGDALLQLNPALYRLGDSCRFIRTVREAGTSKFSFELAELDAGPLITAWLEKLSEPKRDTFASLRDFIIAQSGCSIGEAEDFLSFLIAEQFLFTTAQGDIFERDDDDTRSGVKDLFPGVLPDMFGAWPGLATSRLSAHALLESRTENFLRRLGRASGMEQNDVFYGAAERKVLSGNVAADDEVQLREALDALQRLAVPSQPAALEDFKKRFLEKFEGQKVPLLLALDPDYGIHYLNTSDDTHEAAVLKDLPFNGPDTAGHQLNWTSRHRLLLALWRNCNGRVLELTDADLAALDEERQEDTGMPPSLSLLYTKSKDRLVLEMAGGVTATAIIGRFSVFSKEVDQLCREIAGKEASANPEVIFADIGQLSDSHIDNVNRRKPVYDHFIPINTYTVAAGQQPLWPDDLVVYVQHGRIILESGSLARPVVPRLATAYNFIHNDLALFRFLCDLQYEQLDANLAFDLERFFSGHGPLPAVVYKNVVLSQARWKLREEDIRLLTEKVSLGRLHQWLTEKSIPQVVSVGSGDQQLTFDFGDDWQARSFLSFIKNGRAQIIREYLPPLAKLYAGKEPMLGQYVTFLVKRQPTYSGLTSSLGTGRLNIRRQFYPGTDWVQISRRY